MTDISVEHRGYTIRFSENADEWSCNDVQTKDGRYLSSPSLAKVRAGIDRMLLDVRKASAVRAIEIGSSHHPSFVEALITEFIKTVNNRDYKNRELPPKHVVAVVSTRGGDKKAARRLVTLNDLAPDTPEAHGAFEYFKAKEAEAATAAAVAREAFDGIPRMTLDMIEPLVRIAEGGVDAGDA